MVKERGGKTQLAFRRALGIRGDQDVQFQEIKVSDVDHCTAYWYLDN